MNSLGHPTEFGSLPQLADSASSSSVEMNTNVPQSRTTRPKVYPDHDVVTHARKERSRYENGRHITTNTVEGFSGLVKRGAFGVYHHWGRGYLQQYLNEFDFRYNHRKINDSGRTIKMLKATEWKRLTLREPRRASA
jgi:hypothetical protein